MKNVLLICSRKTNQKITKYDINKKLIKEKIFSLIETKKYKITFVDQCNIEESGDFYNQNVIYFLKNDKKQIIFDVIVFMGCDNNFSIIKSNYCAKILYDYLSNDGYILNFDPDTKKFSGLFVKDKKQIENLASIEIFNIFFRYSKNIDCYVKRKISKKIKSTFYSLQGCNSISRYYNKTINNEVYIFESVDIKKYTNGNLSEILENNFLENKKFDFYIDFSFNVPEKINLKNLNSFPEKIDLKSIDKVFEKYISKTDDLFKKQLIKFKNNLMDSKKEILNCFQIIIFLTLMLKKNKKSIFYVNSYNFKLLKTFFESTKFKKIEYSEDYENNNILLGNITQPLFSHGYYKDNIHISERCGNILLDFYKNKTTFLNLKFKEFNEQSIDFFKINKKNIETYFFPKPNMFVKYQTEYVSTRKTFIKIILSIVDKYLQIFNLYDKNYKNFRFENYDYSFLTNIMNYLNSLNLNQNSEIIFLSICKYIQDPEIIDIIGKYRLENIYKTQNFLKTRTFKN